jgi:hypothetical protein
MQNSAGEAIGQGFGLEPAKDIFPAGFKLCS